MFYRGYLDDCSDDCNGEIGDIAFAFEKVSPVYNEPDYDLDNQYEGNNDLGDVNEVPPEVAHGSTFHHLSNKIEGNDEDPHS